jgi:hypothetical protein
MCPSVQRSTTKDRCPQKPSSKSYNTGGSGSAIVGVRSAAIVFSFSIGPEQKPYDGVMGYPLVLGRTDLEGITLATFGGASACSGIGAYALVTRAVRTTTCTLYCFTRVFGGENHLTLPPTFAHKLWTGSKRLRRYQSLRSRNPRCVHPLLQDTLSLADLQTA